VDDSIDAGVHPAVAAMRRKEGDTKRTVQDAIVGKKYHGQSRTAPELDLSKLSDPTYNPENFFKQAKKLGVNPLDGILNSTNVQKSEEDKKKKKKKDKKKKKKKDKKKEKKKRKKKSSSSSSSSSGGSSSSSSSSSSGKKKKKKAGKEKKESKESKKRKLDEEMEQAAMVKKQDQEMQTIRRQAQASATQRSLQASAASASQQANCPMRPEMGQAIERHKEMAYNSLCVVSGGTQRGAPTSGGPVGG